MTDVSQEARPRVTSQWPTKAERSARGRAERGRVPRLDHAAWEPPSDRADPVDTLQAQDASRIPSLVPVRYARMLPSPFTFYRGAAAIMAADLARTPRTELHVQLCGDAHHGNFGGFASPERALVFDINDFDETHPGPWEWDLKRLAASLAIGGRERGYTTSERRKIVRRCVREYREAMRSFATMTNLDVWYASFDADDFVARWGKDMRTRDHKWFKRQMEKARTKDRMRAFDKLTHIVDGEPRIISDPPLIVPVEDVFRAGEAESLEMEMEEILAHYQDTLLTYRSRLVSEYRLVHAARKVVGVGSVGRPAWIALLLGIDNDDPLFLQFKDAQPSVLAPFVAVDTYAHQGERVVRGQRLTQAASDILLGWTSANNFRGDEVDMYVRQLWDWKISIDEEGYSISSSRAYAQACGWVLARAHARSGDRVAIASYLGAKDVFDSALADFAETYADQNERDYRALVEAAKSGRITAEEEVTGKAGA